MLRRVDGDEHVLAAFRLVDPRDRMAAARRRLPRDELERVAVAVVTDFAELSGQSAPADLVEPGTLVQRATERRGIPTVSSATAFARETIPETGGTIGVSDRREEIETRVVSRILRASGRGRGP